MAEFVPLKPADSDADNLGLVEWTTITTDANEKGIVWTCPDGHPNALKGFHVVSKNGFVEPRAYCNEDGCDFAECLKLAQYATHGPPPP